MDRLKSGLLEEPDVDDSEAPYVLIATDRVYGPLGGRGKQREGLGSLPWGEASEPFGGSGLFRSASGD